MLIFDVDGVLTGLFERRADLRVLDFISKKLDEKSFIVLITGRQYEWLERRILESLKGQITSLNSLEHLFIASENGAVIVTFAGNLPNIALDRAKVVPQEIKDRVREKTKEFQNIFFDSEKKAMISIEINDGLDQKGREAAQKDLDILQVWIKTKILPQDNNLEALRNPLAIDIIYKAARKSLAVIKLLDFIKDKRLKVNEFIVFGDNPSDSSVADELSERNFKVKFAFVGKAKLPKKDYPVLTAKNKYYAEATFAILKSLSLKKSVDLIE